MSRTAAPLSAAALALLGAVAIGCAKPAAPAVEAPPAPAAPVAVPTEVVAAGPPLAAPAVRAIRDGVVAGDATLAADAEAPLAADGAVDVPERGMAIVSWPDGPRAEALGAALTLVDSGVRELAAAQQRGTVRYTIPAAAAPAIALEIDAGSAVVRSSGGVDVIVSLDAPAAAGDTAAADAGGTADTRAAALWVIVVDGAVEVSAEAAVASAAGAAAPLRAALSAGQAMAVAAGGAPVALPVDLSGIETWYGGLVAGDGPPSAASAAFRCVVTAEASPLRAKPAADAAIVDRTVPLARGAVIDIRGRLADGGWLQAFLTASELTGWIPAAELQCIAPTELLAVVDPATVHNVDRTALALKAPTTASFVQDKTEVAPGGCAKLNWDVVAGTAVTFDGQAVPGKGFKVFCPAETTTYTLSWIDEAGKPQSRRLTITVSAALAAAVAAAAETGGGASGGGAGANTVGSSPTATPCVGPECEVTVPPPPATATRRPRPTPQPAYPTEMAPVPTSPPAPTDAPPPPAPTDRPADPTDAPAPPTATPTPEPTGTPPADPSPSPTPEPTGTGTPGATPTPETTPTP